MFILRNTKNLGFKSFKNYIFGVQPLGIPVLPHILRSKIDTRRNHSTYCHPQYHISFAMMIDYNLALGNIAKWRNNKGPKSLLDLHEFLQSILVRRQIQFARINMHTNICIMSQYIHRIQLATYRG